MIDMPPNQTKPSHGRTLLIFFVELAVCVKDTQYKKGFTCEG